MKSGDDHHDARNERQVRTAESEDGFAIERDAGPTKDHDDAGNQSPRFVPRWQFFEKFMAAVLFILAAHTAWRTETALELTRQSNELTARAIALDKAPRLSVDMWAWSLHGERDRALKRGQRTATIMVGMDVTNSGDNPAIDVQLDGTFSIGATSYKIARG